MAFMTKEFVMAGPSPGMTAEYVMPVSLKNGMRPWP
jgi:hypothetical protein